MIKVNRNTANGAYLRHFFGQASLKLSILAKFRSILTFDSALESSFQDESNAAVDVFGSLEFGDYLRVESGRSLVIRLISSH